MTTKIQSIPLVEPVDIDKEDWGRLIRLSNSVKATREAAGRIAEEYRKTMQKEAMEMQQTWASLKEKYDLDLEHVDYYPHESKHRLMVASIRIQN